MIFLSKHRTYPYEIKKEETKNISEKTKSGKYLKKGAIMGLKSFLERDSVLFYKIFNISPTINKENAIDSLEVLNNPYDLLTAIYIFYPDIFEIKNIGKHINVIN